MMSQAPYGHYDGFEGRSITVEPRGWEFTTVSG
jgi:hypothetical protein